MPNVCHDVWVSSSQSQTPRPSNEDVQLRGLFSQALETWRQERDPQSDRLWGLVSEAAAVGRRAYDIGLHFIKSPDSSQRVVATDVLAMVAVQHRTAGGSVARAVIGLLNREEDENVQWSALVALGPTGSKEAIPVLVEWLEKDNADLRCQAVQALNLVMEATGETPEGVEAIAKATSDSDREVKFWATTSLAEGVTGNTPEIRDALGVRLFDNDDEIRNEAIYGLSIRKDPRMATTLEQALRGQRPAPRIFDAVVALGDPVLLPALEQVQPETISQQRLDEIVSTLKKNKDKGADDAPAASNGNGQDNGQPQN